MRTPEEITARINEKTVTERDFFGVERSRYLDCLTFEQAKPWLRDDVTPETWNGGPKTDEQTRAEIRDYLPFAWQKANGCRGLSASRSLGHFRGLLWRLNDPRADEIAASFDGYEYYGKSQLVAVSEFVGFAWREHDNDEWVNAEGDDPLPANAVLKR